jgi:hypothetical protein
MRNTVSGVTIHNAERHSAHTRDGLPRRGDQRCLSAGVIFRALQNSDLMAQRNVFQLQSSAAFHRADETTASIIAIQSHDE